jgi:CubicO group peptidase (beta-lactamase class C family)
MSGCGANPSTMTADEIARRLVERAVAPDCSAGCAAWRGHWRREVGGQADLLFDLASVTKPMTAVAVARTGLDRKTPLADLVPEARGTASERVSLELLLAHRAGLDSHRPLYAPLLRGEPMDVGAALYEAADARRSELAGDPPPTGFPPLYSDLGYVLVGEALRRAVGARDAGEAIARLVLEPLGIGRCAGTIRELDANGIRGPFAATEMASWRGGLIVGAVHDENAWALTGLGGSGHAGLFGTVGAVLTFGGAVLDALEGRTGPLGTRTEVEWLVSERPGGTLRAGFDGKSAEGSSAGARMGANSFGHLGFTGTSIWVDPDAHVVVSLLTNRVCPSRDHFAIRAARPCAHEALWMRACEVSRARS